MKTTRSSHDVRAMGGGGQGGQNWEFCLVRRSLASVRKLQRPDMSHHNVFVSPWKCTETAHSVLGSDANDVVITVPFDFGEKQKSALG